ncbi:MAG: type II secretion system minor pseudopilin GspK [Rhodoferax sp.]|nr:type II secretion system minor pseudopilin GspK [Rhodoferax sp.]
MNAARQTGAALLTAMLTVTLVATFAAAALWQQWRSVEIETAERQRTQLQWVLNGALDWARLILQEDGRDNRVDHLSEPWALPLQEARLSSFLAADKDNASTDDAMEAFLSGQINDQQALLNVRNLVQDGKPYLPAVQAFTRLFERLELPLPQLLLLVDRLIEVDAPSSDKQNENLNENLNDDKNNVPDTPLKPGRWAQLVWLGLPADTLQALAPYATLLPSPTPLNLNTASAEVLQAALPGVDLAMAQQMVAARATAHFKSVNDGFKAAGIGKTPNTAPDAKDFSVSSRYFAVQGRLRLEESAVQETSLVDRNGVIVNVIWRERSIPGVVSPPAPGALPPLPPGAEHIPRPGETGSAASIG